MKNYLTEAIGTYFLVLVIGLSVLAGSVIAPIAIGSALMVMVYMGGHISGGHYNPAVTLALTLRGKVPSAQLVPYWVSQLLGATAAALSVHMLLGQPLTLAPGPEVSALRAVVVEILFTFALALVVLNVATHPKVANNSFYGLAIGFTVGAGAASGGPISGGAFNPAVGTGPILIETLVGGGSIANLWIYWVGPLIGGALAAFVYAIQERA